MKKSHLLLFCSLSLIAFSCTKETKTLKVTPKSVSTYTGKTIQLNTNVDDATFESMDTYYASVDEHGLITANKVGDTEIVVTSSSGTTTIPVNIKSMYRLYPELDPLIGKGVDNLTNMFGTDYTMSAADSGGFMYTYKAPNSYIRTLSALINDGICTGIIVIVSNTFAERLTDYLLERYVFLSVADEVIYFRNHDNNVLIAFQAASSTTVSVMYVQRGNADS